MESRLSERRRLRTALEWRDQAVRWFDYWLKGRDTGVGRIPASSFTAALASARIAIARHPRRVARRELAPAGLVPTTLYLQPDHRLAAANEATGRDQLRYVPSTGVEAGFWWGELLTDQRPVDAFSLTYDSPVLENPWRFSGCRASSCRIERRTARRLVRTPVRRSARWSGHLRHRRGDQRRAAQLDGEPVDLRPARSIRSRGICTSPHGCFPKAIACASRFPMRSGR